ncbi:MAG: hypothetical protein QW062_02740 [Thermoplasmatales archaeon]
MILGIDDNSYIQDENLKEFYDWILSLKPKDVRDKGISQQALYKIKTRIRKNEKLNLKVNIVKVLTLEYQQRETIIH